MARKGKRRFNLRKVKIAGGVTCGALASNDVTSGAVTNAVSDPLRFISLDCSYTWSDIAAVIDDACQFGVAHSDYDSSQIEECLEALGSIDLGDKLAQEKANRYVREIGTIAGAGAPAADSGAAFNDGRRKKVRLNWLMSTGDTLALWVRNGSGVVWTTGSRLVISGDLWVQD